MDIVEESNCVLTIELVINIDYEQMTTAILDYFTPDYKSDDEITSWYVGFEFYKDNLSIFYFNHYDVGDDRHCFEIRDKNADRRVYFKKIIEKFELYLKNVK